MSLNYRMHTKADVPALVRLWTEHGGFDAVDEKTWAERFADGPLGGAAIALATDPASGDIVGNFFFMPMMLHVNGREVLAYRPSAPILSQEARGTSFSMITNPLGHPIMKMYNHAADALRERGAAVIYMIPHPLALRILGLFPNLYTHKYPLFSLPLPLAAPLPLPPGYEAGPQPTSGPEVDQLWQKSARLHAGQVVRDSRILPWKTQVWACTTLGVRRDGELVGLVALRQKEPQWLICDMLCADAGESLRATLVAACNFAHAHRDGSPGERPLRKVALLVTPVLTPTVAEMGFKRDNYDFPLLVHRLDASLDEKDIHPAGWYVSAND
jgi:hypothetical protein